MPLCPSHLHVLVEDSLDLLIDARLQDSAEEVHGDGRICETAFRRETQSGVMSQTYLS